MKVKTRQTALISLAVMLIGFSATLFFPSKTVVFILQSGFEAGLVGGLADWFAVTALFRHPLGIPIPHTAILPNNRDRITQALVSTVENDLLNKESILEKVHQLDVARKFLQICESKIHSDAAKSGIMHISKSVMGAVSTGTVAAGLKGLISNYLDKLDSQKLLELLADKSIEHNYDEVVFDILVDKIEETIKKEEIQKEIGSAVVSNVKKLQVKGIMQLTLNTVAGIVGEDKIGNIVQDFVILILEELRKPTHPSRSAALNSIRDNIKEISNDENIVQKINEYKANLTDNKEFNDFIMMTLTELQNEILNYIGNDQYIKDTVLPFIENVLRQISMDEALINRLERYIQDQISDYIDNNHEKIGKLVRENIDKFDNETLIFLIEDKVGDDLQWIRVNGAICGFLIGLILGVIKLLGVLG